MHASHLLWPSAILVALALLAGQGCASRASYSTWRAAEFNIDGVSSVAVLKFDGTQPAAQNVQTAVVDQLRQSQFFRLVDAAELDRVAPPSPFVESHVARVRRALSAARQLRIDALVVAHVKSDVNWGAEVGSMSFRLGDPISSVLADVELVDVRTGQIRAKQHIKRSWEGKLGREGPNTQEKVAARLADTCGSLIVKKITPHQADVDVQLAKVYYGDGAGDVRKGIAHAKRGEWPHAIRRWEKVLQLNPSSDAALYNLGVAYEAQHDYRRAREMYAAAARKKQTQLYESALARVESAESSYHQAQAQLNRPSPPNPQHQFVHQRPDREPTPARNWAGDHRPADEERAPQNDPSVTPPLTQPRGDFPRPNWARADERAWTPPR